MGMEIRDSLNKKLDNTRMRIALDNAVTKTMIDLRDACIIEVPYITGNLRRSHSYEVRRSSEVIEGLIKNSANYWQYVEFGTSKRNANDWIGRALKRVKPEKKVSDYFHKEYKQ